MDILERQARLEIDRLQGQASLFSNERDNSLKSILSTVFNNEIELVGPDQILGMVYESMGYSITGIDELYRDLVMSKLVYPGSKLKIIDYLARFINIDTNVYSIYRYMDKLHKEFKDKVEVTVRSGVNRGPALYHPDFSTDRTLMDVYNFAFDHNNMLYDPNANYNRQELHINIAENYVRYHIVTIMEKI